MRIWQDYLMNYPAAREDFLAWCDSAQKGIIRQIKEAAANSDTARLQSLANELTVYESIRNIFRAEQREQQSQNERSIQ